MAVNRISLLVFEYFFPSSVSSEVIKFPLKPIIETLSWNFVYASVGDEVENAEQIEKTLEVHVA